MTTELNEYYNTLVFKDNAQTKYYYDVYGVTAAEDGTEIQYPVITINQNRRNATGAENFKNAIEQLETNTNVSAVIVKEYNGFYDGCEPLTENTFQLKKSKKMRRKTSTSKKQQNLPQQVGGLGAINDVLTNFGNTLGMMGFQNGLSGIITASAQQIAAQDKIEDLKSQVADLKNEKSKLEGQVEELKTKNEDLKESHKKIENEMYDLKRDFKYKEERWQNKLTLGNMGLTATLGFLGKKFKLEEKLAGLLEDNEPQQEIQSQTENTQNDSTLNDIALTKSKPEITEINQYLQTLDASRLTAVMTICQYISLSDKHLKRVYNFVMKVTNTEENNSEQKNENNENNGNDNIRA
ncbi:MAG: hypothetical protein IJ150_01325 [Bacteroidales bacterium]|nr:hypothetical protein [Bacteroidales bacterium]